MSAPTLWSRVDRYLSSTPSEHTQRRWLWIIATLAVLIIVFQAIGLALTVTR